MNWDVLPGYKTKIAVVIFVIVSGLRATGIISDEIYQAIASLASALGFWGVYMKVQRTQ